jgi:uncharacterized integral membrane protein
VIIFAVVLMVLCAVFALGIVVGSSDSVELAFFTFSTNTSVDMVLFVGLVTGIIFMVALWLLTQALRRERSRHVERKEMEHRRDELEREKAELERKLSTGRPTRTETVQPRFQPPADGGNNPPS